MTDWLPGLDVSQFKGSRTEMNRFIEQRFARIGLAAFADEGRGVVIVHIDDSAKTLRAEYNTMETDDGSTEARHVRALMDTYDPARQVVMVYRDAARGRDIPGIVDVDLRH